MSSILSGQAYISEAKLKAHLFTLRDRTLAQNHENTLSTLEAIMEDHRDPYWCDSVLWSTTLFDCNDYDYMITELVFTENPSEIAGFHQSRPV